MNIMDTSGNAHQPVLPWVVLRKSIGYLPVVNLIRIQRVSKLCQELVFILFKHLTLSEFDLTVELNDLGLTAVDYKEAISNILQNHGRLVISLKLITFQTRSDCDRIPQLADSFPYCTQLTELECRHETNSGCILHMVCADYFLHDISYKLLALLPSVRILKAVLRIDKDVSYSDVWERLSGMDVVACLHVASERFADFKVKVLAMNGVFSCLKGLDINRVYKSDFDSVGNVNQPNMDPAVNIPAEPSLFVILSASITRISIVLEQGSFQKDNLGALVNVESLSIFSKCRSMEDSCLNFMRHYTKLTSLSIFSLAKLSVAQLQNIPENAPLQELELCWAFDNDCVNFLINRRYPLKILTISFSILRLHFILISPVLLVNLINSCAGSIEVLRLMIRSSEDFEEILNQICEEAFCRLRVLEISYPRSSMLELCQFLIRRRILFTAGRASRCRLFIGMTPETDASELVAYGPATGLDIVITQPYG